ncbi:hypothetical protein CBR_g24248 [Chara braunii]|uniref:Trafficking protein particle complex subunit 13 n=1 Tax=Chara braunii TaxID=69332 RepID=A0A388JM54_CHABU|nr:hypothetical protein CBR_g24248 [Chara braunii]|eukprot:GBG58896.1 hypothetical protein CBR_g24248 [Chara braunii]
MRDGSSHSLAFRVMRLCRPSLQVDLPLRCAAGDLRYGEDDDVAERMRSLTEMEQTFSGRCEINQPLDACGLTGMLVLPQEFGSIYLGETLCSFISLCNVSDHDVEYVGIKVELQTERQRTSLADNTRAPLTVIKAGARNDFIIEHIIKELGTHCLVCSAMYSDSEGERRVARQDMDVERKLLHQKYKFVASNPVVVRTKIRPVRESTFLEVGIQNATKAPLFLDYVKFEPSTSYTSSLQEADEGDGEPDDDGEEEEDDILKGLFNRRIHVVESNGGERNYLYHLRRVQSAAGSSAESANTLGKLEMMWKTTLGEPGHLQTQPIMSNTGAKVEIEVRLEELPSRIVLEHPFQVKCRIKNNTDHRTGPLRVAFSRDDAAVKAVVVNGTWAQTLSDVQPQASLVFPVHLVALAAGVQKITGLCVLDARDGTHFAVVPPTEIFVES